MNTIKLQEKLKKLEDKREKKINKYIIPLEISISELRDKINSSSK